MKRLEAKGLDPTDKTDRLVLDITPQEFDENKQLMTEMLQTAVKEYEE